MTTYTAIAAGELDGDSPVTDTLMSRLSLNPIAMFEGAAGAPRLSRAAFDMTTFTAGAVGTYCFAQGVTDVALGGTAAGSDLTPASAAASVSLTGTPAGATLVVGATLSGTWQCMGYFDRTITSGGGSTATLTGATLWLRIA